MDHNNNEIGKLIDDVHKDGFDRVETILKETRDLQINLLKLLRAENSMYTDTAQSSLVDIAETFQKIPHYQSKIKSLSKDMADIRKKVEKLKKRALALQTSGQK
ncbi:uncharacterized protein MONOS_7852 [Monocercomonoides exilis]|uniref:uncharacterized protein n=1 Tax=Monocercomonoides exilis TaxID=2049356 RepID=UPI00355AC70C|nr:hypothetical protein MONOS_7852 [Monocercomonoides exilis]|eukprot:MONOS_7852.1-p1 / transcript=MONOS_7852.1 / gene=MONOS_7852 / organism=Monocercomonoides_exilis_PA203 / gene_product=unspecified product / transcript_product=unspecified product / location=Mono_scaffold00280:18194-18684(-) / protein_length=103 / sequence_SO=supercontig / SO=protein_coding / is_pseudo=false